MTRRESLPFQLIFGGDLAAASTDAGLLVANLKQQRWMTVRSASDVYAWAFTSSGYAALTSRAGVYVWRLGESIPELVSVFPADAQALRFSPANSGADRLAALLKSGGIAIADAPRFERPITIQRERKDSAAELTWIDDHLVVTGGNWIEVFDVKQPDRPPIVFEASEISASAIHRNRMAIATRGEVVIVDIGSVPTIANLSDEERRKLVCTRAGRDLTREEWTTYLSDRAYEQPCKQFL